MVRSLEHRKTKRLDCLVPVEGRGDSRFCNCRTLDLSQGGLGFVSDKDVVVGKEIFVELELAETDYPVMIKGKVKWVRQIPGSENYRIGLSFQEVLRGSKTRFNKYFKKATGRRSAIRF